MLHEVCHIFDIIRWISGSDIETLYCVDSRDDDEIITLKMKSGCIATILDSGYVHPDMPKEHLEVIVDRGAVIVDDFVELRSYGSMDYDNKYTFDGHSHPNNEFMHKFALSRLGINGFEALRRMQWELIQKKDQLLADEEFTDKAMLERYLNGGAPNPNYMINKGWIPALEHFAKCAADGTESRNARAADGLAASAAANAAIESRTSGNVVRF